MLRGQYHKSAGTLSCRVPQSQYSGGSGYVDNRFGWAGYLWDPVLEVYHVRHRVYDPADGRWLQPDPIGHAGGWNLYEYCHGDYFNFLDPTGLDEIGWWDTILYAVGLGESGGAAARLA